MFTSFISIFQGIEKKTAKLQGSEKAVVARHEAGHAVVGTAVANLLSGQPRVEVIIIITCSEKFLFFLIYCNLMFFVFTFYLFCVPLDSI